jgi:REP element-mobilizing transposase RayT
MANMYPGRQLPGMSFLITRRTVCRTHLFQPDAVIAQLFLYILAVCAARYGIIVHAVVLMSTHEHIVLSDPLGKLSEFLAQLHRLMALTVKIHRKWQGAVWDSDPPSEVELITPQAVIEKLAYVMANPVEAGLVMCAHQWPGVTTLPTQLGTAQFTVERPEIYFDADNPIWPEAATLQLQMPEIGLSDEAIRERVAAELDVLERKARAEVKAKGWRFLGPQRIAQLSPLKQASSSEPVRKRNPTFAVGRGQRTAFFHAVKVLRTFRKLYQEALSEWRKGVRDVIFPAGTRLMRVLHQVRVAPA